MNYQTVYSGGNGQVYALGIVPHSHIAIVAYSMDDGEIINQVTNEAWDIEKLNEEIFKKHFSFHNLNMKRTNIPIFPL